MRTTRHLLSSARSKDALSLLFLGGDAFSIGVLEPLLASKQGLWKDLLIVTSGEKQVGRGSRGTRRIVPPLLTYAEEQGLGTSTLPPTGFKDWQIPEGFLPPASNSNPPNPPPLLSTPNPSPSPILITASFGHIIPTPFLKTYFREPYSRLNVHPSLLPEYRGAAPIQWSIADSWKVRRGRTGVTVQSLELGRGKVDCGDVWAQEGGVEIDERSTYNSLLPTLAKRGGELLVSTLQRIRDGTASCYPQPSSQGETFRKAGKISPTTARVDFQTQSAMEVEARHRAFGFQEPIWTTVQGNPIQLLECGLSDLKPGSSETGSQLRSLRPGQARYDRPNNRLLVRCAYENNPHSSSYTHSQEEDDEMVTVLLEVKRVRQAGKKEMGVRDWWNGLRGVGKGMVVDLGT
ncbi:formyl transferase [Filobasidium floriforme]|uniref:formyl transferase n=1 Tax=Filobasidium floriforme TaxID=5210 RepID=UPI001E8DECC7|nr:formyl transferase [Filobasidium floriforme]KAH8088216.1 formyl transferase [Filobasidium floriforme]